MSVSARRLPIRILTVFAFLLLAAIAVRYLLQELRSSQWQAQYFSEWAEKLHFSVQPGPSEHIRFPDDGPYDVRLGYVGLPHYIDRLRKEGFSVTEQARIAPLQEQLSDRGLSVIYHEKNQAGLQISDGKDRPLFAAAYPTLLYPNFEAIPPVVLHTLLFIENRKLLDEHYPTLNPAVEWERFGKAALDVLRKTFGADINAAGGSTLATQLEKFRHSPGGITASIWEKLRQMAGASLRAYLNGPNTLPARRNIALNYLNSVPLSAANNYGEVQGVGDGLQIWYGTDFATVNRLLSAEAIANSTSATPEQGRAYRQVLCLLLAQRRPSYFLGAGHDKLQKLADSHLRILADSGIISASLRDAALSASTELNQADVGPVKKEPFIEHKTQTMIRTKLAGSLGVTRLYDLDRLDLTAKSTLDLEAQKAAAAVLIGFRDPEKARAAGLMGFHLLSENNDLSRLVYSLTLYERAPIGNLLRIQTDNYEQPLDINEGIRLDLGSTAKLRTTVLYLQIIDEIYRRYAGETRDALKKVTLHSRDHLSQWVIEQLLQNPQLTLPQILQAALDRRYSASPGESFFTGGGLHSFANFNKEDNGKIMPVRAALRDSVNLVFIRLMRDVVYYYLYRPGGVAERVEQGGEALRHEYLMQFADQEGKVYLKRFYSKYRGKKPEELLPLLTKNVHPLASRLTTVYRSVHPDHDAAALKRYLQTYYKAKKLSDKDIDSLYNKYGVDKFNLRDRGYIARVHPLELWLIAYLHTRPEATLQEIYEASVEQRQEVYTWLLKNRNKYAMTKRIQTLMEKEAFMQIRDAWKRVGYPFNDMTASYASSIGASADRPAALAKLMGILLNDGAGYPTAKFEKLHFAAGTPFETQLQLLPARGERIMSPEVAAAARGAVMEVVAQGTAARLRDVYKDPNGNPLPIGGKTGTGDHVRKIYAGPGRLIGSEVVSRSATFVFFLGDRHFGVLTAYVAGKDASRYDFTSSLPVQVLKSLRPVIEPMLWQNSGAATVAAPAKAPTAVTAAPAPETKAATKPARKPVVKAPSKPVFVPVPLPPMFQHLQKPGLTPKTPPGLTPPPRTAPKAGFAPAPKTAPKPVLTPKPTPRPASP